MHAKCPTQPLLNAIKRVRPVCISFCDSRSCDFSIGSVATTGLLRLLYKTMFYVITSTLVTTIAACSWCVRVCKHWQVSHVTAVHKHVKQCAVTFTTQVFIKTANNEHHCNKYHITVTETVKRIISKNVLNVSDHVYIIQTVHVFHKNNNNKQNNYIIQRVELQIYFTTHNPKT